MKNKKMQVAISEETKRQITKIQMRWKKDLRFSKKMEEDSAWERLESLKCAVMNEAKKETQIKL